MAANSSSSDEWESSPSNDDTGNDDDDDNDDDDNDDDDDDEDSMEFVTPLHSWQPNVNVDSSDAVASGGAGSATNNDHPEGTIATLNNLSKPPISKKRKKKSGGTTKHTRARRIFIQKSELIVCLARLELENVACNDVSVQSLLVSKLPLRLLTTCLQLTNVPPKKKSVALVLEWYVSRFHVNETLWSDGVIQDSTSTNLVSESFIASCLLAAAQSQISLTISTTHCLFVALLRGLGFQARLVRAPSPELWKGSKKQRRRKRKVRQSGTVGGKSKRRKTVKNSD